jgi:hypothetical protein
MFFPDNAVRAVALSEYVNRQARDLKKMRVAQALGK